MSSGYIFLGGVLASVAGGLLMLVMRYAWNIPSFPEVLLDRSTLFIPLSIYKIFILALGPLAKPVFLASFVLLQLALGGALALAWIWGLKKLYPQIETTFSQGRAGKGPLKAALEGVLFCTILWLASMLVFLPLTGLGFLGGRLTPGALAMSISIAALLLLYGLTLSAYYLLSWCSPEKPASPVEAPPQTLRDAQGDRMEQAQGDKVEKGQGSPPEGSGRSNMDSRLRGNDSSIRAQGDMMVPPGLQRRRLLIKRVSLGIVSLFLAGGFIAMITRIWKMKAPEEETTGGTPVSPPALISPEITPNSVFYTVSKNFIDPKVDGAAWKLEVKGEVSRPLSFSLEELKRLPAVERFLTLECISNEVGGDLIGNARWKGVPLRDILEMASASRSAKKVVLHGADEYSDSITLDRAVSPANLLAYEMNGETLPDSHGYPARLLIPGIYGMKNVKWLTGIEVVDRDYYGYWQERGWSDRAEIVIMSRIDSPEHNRKYGTESISSISGVAFAGDQGISRVEVSMDEGRSWSAAEMKEALSPYTWVLWVFEWKPQPGRYTIWVRAADKKGLLQESREQEPFPEGATGYHKVRVNIV